MQPTNILIRGVNWLGDAVMTTPAIARLRERFPASRLSLLTPHDLADLWRHHPDLDEVVPFQSGDSPWRIGRRLRNQGYDCALVFPNSPRSALEVFLAGIPRRIGYRRPWRHLFLTEPVAPRPAEVPMRKRSTAEIQRLISLPHSTSPSEVPTQAHHLHQYLHLAGVLGADTTPCEPRLRVTEDESTLFRGKWLNTSPAPPHWLGLNPGAAYGPAKRWPEDRFVETATRAHKNTGCGCLITGGPGEKALAESIASALTRAGVSPVVNLAGQTSLRQLCVALKACHALLTNDSGPMHLAAALETPVVAVFGSTSPDLTGPGRPDAPGPHVLLRHPTPCAPCFLRDCPIDLRCLHGVTPDNALDALLGVLRPRSGGTHL